MRVIHTYPTLSSTEPPMSKETFSITRWCLLLFVFTLSTRIIQLILLQSGLLWYTSRIQDDNSEVAIYPRCFDLHSDCVRWEREGKCNVLESSLIKKLNEIIDISGFCDKNSHSSRRNPGWHEWVSQNCFISCSLPGCDSETV